MHDWFAEHVTSLTIVVNKLYCSFKFCFLFSFFCFETFCLAADMNCFRSQSEIPMSGKFKFRNSVKIQTQFHQFRFDSISFCSTIDKRLRVKTDFEWGDGEWILSGKKNLRGSLSSRGIEYNSIITILRARNYRTAKSPQVSSCWSLVNDNVCGVQRNLAQFSSGSWYATKRDAPRGLSQFLVSDN